LVLFDFFSLAANNHGVDGVIGVIDGDRASLNNPMTASTIVENVQTRAQAALSSSPFYELRELRVDQRHETLIISGIVSSYYHKQLAQEVIRSVCRDTKVINKIRVEPEFDMA